MKSEQTSERLGIDRLLSTERERGSILDMHDGTNSAGKTGGRGARDDAKKHEAPPSGPHFGPENVSDPVALALAEALTLAARAGRFDVVAELARGLAARRRLAEAPDVASIDDARDRRKR